MTEPLPTAIALGAFGVLVLLSTLFSRASGRIGVPVALLFLLVGVLAGSEGIGGIVFEDYQLAFRIGTAALVLILFDGGINTPLASLKTAIRPAGVLATFGVVLTALFVCGGAWLLGFSWQEALLLGAIVSSTDAAAVFSILRGSGIQLKRRLGLTLELESGLNDPMAVILTTAVTARIAQEVAGQGTGWLLLLGNVVAQLGVGVIIGVLVGKLGAFVLARASLTSAGLYPLITTAIALIAFAAATILWGSGFLAVYVAAMVIGNSAIPYRASVLRVHDTAAWFCQVSMFLLLGLLVFPSRLLDVAVLGLGLGLFLAFIARPAAVLLSLLPFAFPWKERLYISWVGLRGAVPIVLATIPVMAAVPGAGRVFDVVFFIVLVNSFLPGSTIRFVTDKLGLRSAQPPPPPAILDVSSARVLSGSVVSYFIDKASAAAGVPLADIPLPEGSSIMVIVRGDALLAPRPGMSLQAGDHIYVIVAPDQEPLVNLMFGGREEM